MTQPDVWQSIINPVLAALLKALVLAALYYATHDLIPLILKYYRAHTSAMQRSEISVVASQLVVWAEKQFPTLAGSEKFKEVVAQLNSVFGKVGLSTAEIEGIVQQAFEQAAGIGWVNKPAPAGGK